MADQPTAKELTLKRNQRKATRMNATKAITAAKTLKLDGPDLDRDKILAAISKLQTYQMTLKEYDELIFMNTDDDKLTDELAKADEVNEAILDMLCTLNAKLAVQQHAVEAEVPLGNSTPTDGVQPSQNNNKHRLPKLSVVKFGGNPLQWDEFWDDYSSSVHEQSDISVIDKFKYLRSFLVDEPLRLVEGYRLTAQNYGQAVDALKQRYGDTEIAVFSHLEALLALPVASYDIPQLRQVYDSCEAHIRSLVGLGLPESTFGQVFTPIILSKLPRFVKMELHRQNGSKPWTLQNLRDLLKGEIAARERSDMSFNTSGSSGGKGCSPAAFSAAQGQYKKGKNLQKAQTATASALIAPTSNEKVPKCVFCSEQHYSGDCQKFPDLDSRMKQVKGHCFSCFRKGHSNKSCPNKRPCFHCKKPGHHQSLCRAKFGCETARPTDNVMVSAESASMSPVDSSPAPDSQLGFQTPGGRSVLQTALAKLKGPAGTLTARFFFDTGGSRSFITESCARKIGARRVGEETVSIGRFRDNKRSASTFTVFGFEVILPNGQTRELQMCGIDVLSCEVQLVPLELSGFPLFEQSSFAEPLRKSPEMVQIDILIGSDLYYEFIGQGQVRLSNGIVLLESVFGYVAAGRMMDGIQEPFLDSSMILLADDLPKSTTSLERLWSLEDVGIKDCCDKTDDEIAVQQFEQTVRFEDSRFYVRWPLKPNSPELPDNFDLALSRLRHQHNRLKRNCNMLEAYDKTIKSQVDAGIVELAPKVPDGTVHFLPHHGVVNLTRSTTKLRVVYDASARASKDSPALNDVLLRGPVLLADAVGLLLRFRLPKIAIVSDIEKAFLQIALQAEDRDVTRFLWLHDPNKDVSKDNLVVFRFCRVPFGIICSSFLLAASVGQLIQASKLDVAKKIADNYYVDNVFGGENSVEEAVRYYRQSKQFFQTGSMNLREFYTNDSNVRSQIAPSDLGKSTSCTSVLGLKWNFLSDSISCYASNKLESNLVTKRSILRGVASVFDPLGFFSPVTIRGRLLLQELWQEKYNWDESVSDDIVRIWEPLCQDFKKIPSVQLPRRVDITHPPMLQLHCFCDASQKAYAAVVYLRYESERGTQCSLLFSKSRVCPLKQRCLTIPRLELIATWIGPRVISFVESQIRLPIKKKFVWSDSTSALQWIRGFGVTNVFVRNRVREILQTPNIEFRYVPSEDNPADIPSRGVPLEELEGSSRWWYGPHWLSEVEIKWPTEASACVHQSSKPAALGQDLILSMASQNEPCPVEPDLVFDLSRYSSLPRLLRVTCYIQRAILLFKRRGTTALLRDPISALEMSQAKQFWQRRVQQQVYGASSVNTPQSKQFRNLTAQLGIFTDEQGFLRCKGRFQNSDLSLDEKFPKLLLKDHPFTSLVIRDAHECVFHAGVTQTLLAVRSEYWIIHGRSRVKKEINDCCLCRKIAGRPFRIPNPPPLPGFRVKPGRPFSSVGLDYLGPLFVTTNTGPHKVWLSLFTCAATRAVYLDVVETLSAQDFLLCLQRFVANHGCPTLIVSDNATQFHAVRKALAKIWQEICTSDEVQGFSSKKGIGWKFIPEMAPWMGGFYERLVGVVKSALKRALDHRCVRTMELITVVQQITSVVNNRPLLLNDNDPSEPVLTPSHLLSRAHNQLPLIPDLQEDDYNPQLTTADDLILQYKRVQKMLDVYWNLWQRGYLAKLRESNWKFTQWNTSELAPLVGTVVLVGDKTPRGSWKLGRITTLIPSADRVCRSVTLELANGKCLRRPLKLLYPLELSKSLPEVSENGQQENFPVRSGPKRKAAVEAATKIRSMAANESQENN